jgi:starch-binding outer membrane protein, SusD/RagB family
MKNKILILLLVISSLSSCDRELLNLTSLTEPVDATFYTNEQELELGLIGAYNTLVSTLGYGLPMTVAMDNSATDIAVARQFEGGSGFAELGTGSHSATSEIYRTMYSRHYNAIGRVNSLLANMERAKNVVSTGRYAEIQAQALFIRAYHYMNLVEIFGDVPLVLEPFKTIEDALVPRNPKSAIVDQILQDLNTAANSLPNTWAGANKGRITKGATLALRARIALYDKRYDIAATSAKAIIDNESAYSYQLHPNYEALFSLTGGNSAEIILSMPYKDGFRTNEMPRSQGSRNHNGYSTNVPTQSMIDSYEAIDGKPIDESAVYNPKQPFANRDPRMSASIILPGTVWAGQIFESHPDSTRLRRADGVILGNNNNCRKVIWPAAFCGYLWKKYTIQEYQAINQIWSDVDFILIRLAEVLLTYAEAKIELNQIDNTVLNAINRIRARAYGVNVANTAGYPAITSTNQAELRKVIRRERKVELANEGFRLYDIRRWRIAEKVMPVKIYGQILNRATATGIPQIDDDGFVSYAGIESQYDLNNDARFPNAQNRKFDKNRDYLCPLPQQEIDTYNGFGVTLIQNPGY